MQPHERKRGRRQLGGLEGAAMALSFGSWVTLARDLTSLGSDRLLLRTCCEDCSS
jgi:hypothetical protein